MLSREIRAGSLTVLKDFKAGMHSDVSESIFFKLGKQSLRPWS